MSKSTTLYDNWRVFSIDNELLSYCTEKKANWYLKKKLAEAIGEKQIKLNFVNKGKGTINTPLGEKLEDKCVVCGANEQLTKHHIVPKCYRKQMPYDYGSRNHFDVVAVCVECHEKYESLAADMHNRYKELAGWTSYKPDQETRNKLNTIAKFKTLGERSSQIPEPQRTLLLQEVNDYFQQTYTLEQFKDHHWFCREVAFMKTTLHELKLEMRRQNVYATLVVQTLKDDRAIEDFILTWRQHFLDTMKPQFLPSQWLSNYKTFFKRVGA